MKNLSRDEILKQTSMQVVDVTVPEWGGTVSVKQMSGFERDAFDRSLVVGDKTDTTNMRAKLAVATCVDKDGKPLFKPDDADALGKTCASALDRIFKMAAPLNGITQDDIEDAEKNSADGSSDGSGSE